MQNNDVTVRRKSYAAAKEIKASAHYAYVVNGITLDGSKFETGGFVEEGTCLVPQVSTNRTRIQPVLFQRERVTRLSLTKVLNSQLTTRVKIQMLPPDRFLYMVRYMKVFW